MNSSSSPENSGICPYQTDIEYLLAEVEWIRIRSRRIEAQRCLEPDEGTSSRINRRCGTANADTVARLLKEELELRQEIDNRLVINRTVGPILGLDKLCQDHCLGDVERTLLLLGFVPCLGYNAFLGSVSRVDNVTTSGTLSLELVSLFLEMQPEAHLKGLLCLLPDAPLCQGNLVRLTYIPTSPSDILGVGIELSGKALAEITGIQAFHQVPAELDFGDRP